MSAIVLIRTDSHYTVDRKRVRAAIEAFLVNQKMKGTVEVSVSVVGDRMMKKLNKTWRNKDSTTDVLSFPLYEEEGEGKAPFIAAPDDVLRLGDIVISYPQAVSEAAAENKFVDAKIDELLEHALLHLIGKHHDE